MEVPRLVLTELQDRYPSLSLPGWVLEFALQYGNLRSSRDGQRKSKALDTQYLNS